MIIYKITNDVNNKVYIGQTVHTLAQRKKGYENETNYRTGEPRLIIRAMRKYGLEHFHFEEIDTAETAEELDEKERYWIQYYHSCDTSFGYNMERGGNSVGKHSEETKRKISEAQKGALNHMYGKRGSLNVTSKPVIELTTGQIFGSASLAAEFFHVQLGHVCDVARGERGSTADRVFRYLDENGNIIMPEKVAAIKKFATRDAVLPQYRKYI